MRSLATLLMLIAPSLAAEPNTESVVPADFTDPARWYTAECTIEPVADAPGKPGAAIHWHVDVDHTAGEPNYPIGWPRMGTTPAGGNWDWSGYDSLRFDIRCETSRPALPDQAVGMVISMPDRGNQRSDWLTVKQDEWTEVSLPIEQLSNPVDVARLQFYIAESNWKHGDKLDCWIANLRLVRYTAPTVLDVRSLESLVAAESPYLVALVRTAGISDGDLIDAALVVRQNGEVRHQAAVKLIRGSQRLTAPVSGLQPGPAQLSISLAGAESATAEVTIVAGPFAE